MVIIIIFTVANTGRQQVDAIKQFQSLDSRKSRPRVGSRKKARGWVTGVYYDMYGRIGELSITFCD